MQNKKRIKILLVDDDKIMHFMLQKIFKKQQDLKVIGDALVVKRRLNLFVKKTAVVVIDVNMPSMRGIEATKKIKAEMLSI